MKKDTILKEWFERYQLTDGQNALLDKLEDFLIDKTACFLLKGYAGTGKTFLMKGLTDYLVATNRSFRIAAPTGRAAKVISQKTRQKAFTVHKTIYSSEDLKEFKTKDENGTETFKFFYGIRKNEDPDNTIYIIDEASMLANNASEGEFFRFGSGFLLNDLIDYVDLANSNRKMLFIGDAAQLPPVKMNFSPALDAHYLSEQCKLTSSEYELTEVVRQGRDSGILHNANQIRNAIKANLFNQLKFETSDQDIEGIKDSELLAKYLKACNNSIDDETIIITYSNALANEYNAMVRNHFFPNQPIIAVGDKVVLTSNNYNYPQMELLNGDFGVVKEVSPVNECRTIKLKRRNELDELVEIEVSLAFRKVVLVFTDVAFNRHAVPCYIIESLLHSTHRELSPDELKALYIDFKVRNPKLKPGTKEFGSVLRHDVYFNALRVKFGYAITCHKAQGGEWKNAFLNCRAAMGHSNSGYFRWLYTGVTRAKEKLYTINEPHFTLASNMRAPLQQQLKRRDDLVVLNNTLSEMDLPFGLGAETPLLKHIYLAIRESIKNTGVKIEAIKHDSYKEHYTFSREGERGILIINYNAKNIISAIQKPAKPNDLLDMVVTNIEPLKGKLLLLEKQDATAQDEQFEFEQEFLKDFYLEIMAQIQGSGIVISKIESKNYHEIYEFEKAGYVATFKFHYNGKKIFTKSEVINNKTTGLVDEIVGLLK